MAFHARKVKKGLFEVVGLEKFLEGKFHEWSAKLGFSKAAAAPVAKKLAKKVATAKHAVKATASKKASIGPSTVEHLVAVLDHHPKKASLVKAGKAKDQLLRSLIPLYLSQKMHDVEITSGDTSHFWKLHGVKFLAPNAAKALREHIGYARRTKVGPMITPSGIKYVESALKGQPLKRAA